MELIKELIADLVDEKKSLSNTLRKAKILASISKLEEMKNWIKFELEGYNDNSQIPEYRKVGVQNVGYFSGPFGSSVQNIIIPTYNLPGSLKSFAENCLISNGVSELEVMINGSDQIFERKWLAEQLIIARKYITLPGYNLIDVKQPLSKAIFAGIIDNVKNKLLDFLLDLDENKLILEGVEMSKEKIDQVRNTFHVNVYGDNANVATGQNVSQRVTTVSKNDIKSLMEYFREQKIDDEDISDLQKAIKIDGAPKGNEFGTQVTNWIGRMISKASSGAWQVALSVAPAILTEGLRRYFGM